MAERSVLCYVALGGERTAANFVHRNGCRMAMVYRSKLGLVMACSLLVRHLL